MNTIDRFVHVEFRRFKAFTQFAFPLRRFNILVGPNNSGKSTVLAAFRILAAAIRRASARTPQVIRGPDGQTYGHPVDLSSVSVAEESIFHDYDDSEPATVTFRLATGSTLTLYFPEVGRCYLIPDAQGRPISTASAFRSQFNCSVGFVPILGPVDQTERLYEREAARLALYNYGAARNFRNIWYHYPEHFEAFREILRRTWPGMDIERPKIDSSHSKPRLYMFCPEERIPREIFWSGFGFQVWCQMLTHLVQSRTTSMFLIDEPDIYLHAELQRQLLGLLRELGPDILIATHSTEIITEAEADDIILINKKRRHARRIKSPAQLEEVFKALGSNLNPILTQLAKTRRAIFVEGKDFQIISKFARRLGAASVGNRSDFAVVPVEGFNPQRIRNLKEGMETTLGGRILAGAILDRDYRCDGERQSILTSCRKICSVAVIHERKEIENFLLVPTALNRAAERAVLERNRRTGSSYKYNDNAAKILDEFAVGKKTIVMSRLMASCRSFERAKDSGIDDATVTAIAIDEFERNWKDANSRLGVIPGKEALSYLNTQMQKRYAVTLTATGIIDAMIVDEIPSEMRDLMAELKLFCSSKVRGGVSS
jgi:energy-coupling factor transporter ATP-binding protein EcfA2